MDAVQKLAEVDVRTLEEGRRTPREMRKRVFDGLCRSRGTAKTHGVNTCHISWPRGSGGPPLRSTNGAHDGRRGGRHRGHESADGDAGEVVSAGMGAVRRNRGSRHGEPGGLHHGRWPARHECDRGWHASGREPEVSARRESERVQARCGSARPTLPPPAR